MSSIIRLRRGVIAVILLASGPAHAGPTRLPHPPYPRPDGERHLPRSPSSPRLLPFTYSAPGALADLSAKLSLWSHTLRRLRRRPSTFLSSPSHASSLSCRFN